MKDIENSMIDKITDFRKEFDPLKQPLMD